MNIAFLDIETTGLDPLKHEIMEVAVILRKDSPIEAEQYLHFSLPISEMRADPKALEINGYRERYSDLKAIERTRGKGRSVLYDMLKDALVVGNNVQFDLRFIEQLLGMSPWYYAPLDLKAYAAGMCGLARPASTAFLEELAGTKVGKDAHTALADAEWNVRVYDALVDGRRYRVGA